MYEEHEPIRSARGKRQTWNMSRLSSAKIMLVEPDSHVVEMLVDCLPKRFDARMTCTARAEDALDVEMLEPHDVVIAEVNLPGMSGIEMARHLLSLSKRPVILTSEHATLGQSIEAIHLGVQDFFPKPFAVAEVLDSVERTVRDYQATRQRDRRYRKLRLVVKRVLRERRELNERIELICRDLVGAHRRLVHRVLETEQTRQV